MKGDQYCKNSSVVIHQVYMTGPWLWRVNLVHLAASRRSFLLYVILFYRLLALDFWFAGRGVWEILGNFVTGTMNIFYHILLKKRLKTTE